MRDLLLILWIALIGATRIDFLGGAGPLVLTPFLMLSPLVLVSEVWRIGARGWNVEVRREAQRFLVAVAALLAVLLTSTFFAFDLPTSARRVSLLFVQVGFVFLIGVAIMNRRDPGRLLLQGAYAGFGLSLVMNVGQVMVWFRESLWPQTLDRVVSLEPGVYFGVIPRLTGVAHDPNLGGLIVVFYLALIYVLAPPSRMRRAALTLGALAVLLTISRSAVLAGLALWIFTVLRRFDVRVTPGRVGVVGGVAGTLTATYLLVPGLLDPFVELARIVGHRFTPEEGSTSDHALLLIRGWEVATENLKHVLIGIGYGNAHHTVQDIFPGNEYGNYHSLFLTFFAESGVFALILGLGIFAHALVHGGAYQPLVAAMIAYNLFQQAHTDPVLWLTLLLAWTAAGLRAGRPPGVADPGAVAPAVEVGR